MNMKIQMMKKVMKKVMMKDYDNTIATLNLIPNLKLEDYTSLTVS